MILNVFAIVLLVYAILVELWLLVSAAMSGYSLRRDRFISKFHRIEDLLSSDVVPPVSIIVPAYNEESGIAQ